MNVRLLSAFVTIENYLCMSIKLFLIIIICSPHSGKVHGVPLLIVFETESKTSQNVKS